jgi:hypothetical protein
MHVSIVPGTDAEGFDTTCPSLGLHDRRQRSETMRTAEISAAGQGTCAGQAPDQVTGRLGVRLSLRQQLDATGRVRVVVPDRAGELPAAARFPGHGCGRSPARLCAMPARYGAPPHGRPSSTWARSASSRYCDSADACFLLVIRSTQWSVVPWQPGSTSRRSRP